MSVSPEQPEENSGKKFQSLYSAVTTVTVPMSKALSLHLPAAQSSPVVDCGCTGQLPVRMW